MGVQLVVDRVPVELAVRSDMLKTIHSGLASWSGMPVITPTPEMLPVGVYTRKGKPYWLIGLARMHETGDEYVAYVPLYTRPEFAGTPSMSLRPLAEFLVAFEWAGTRIPPE